MDDAVGNGDVSPEIVITRKPPPAGAPAHAPHRTDEVIRQTVRWEAIRNGLTRPVMTASGGSGLLVVTAIQYFDASKTAKGLIAGAVQVGMIATPLVVWMVAKSRLSVSKSIALLLAASAIATAMAGIVDGFPAYFACVMAGVPLAAMAAPLFTALWRQNVPGSIRGQRYSMVSWIGTAMAVLVSLGIREYIGEDASRYRLPVIGLAVMLMAASAAMVMIPSQPLARPRRFPLPHLSILWQYPLFGYITMAWMLMGFANLATIPLRAEYVSAPAYGLAYSPGRTLLLVMVIPVAAQLVSMLIWGKLFDVANFLLVRLGINTAFGLSIALFFVPNFTVQVIAATMFGIGAGGGAIAWAMWVTKYSPPERTADFMAVHTFLTGCRGVVGPVLAFHALDWRPVQGLGEALGLNAAQVAAWLCVGLVAVSCLMLTPIIHTGRRSNASEQPA